MLTAVALLVALLAPGLGVTAPSPAVGATEAGIVDFSYGTSVSAPTGEKPQSKLWIVDGQWWGSLFDRASTDYHIFRLSPDHSTWTDTGVLVDERTSAHMDTLWDGQHLYVVTAGMTETNTSHHPRIVRFSYDAGQWSRDPGFPVAIGSSGVETITIAKDSTGMLWVAYAQGAKVYVQHSLTADDQWSGRIAVPSPEATVSSDDIAAVVAYDGDKVGVMWSNGLTERMLFATHVDGTADTAWTVQTAYERPEGSDDHINLRSLQADPAGRVLAAVKTSLDLPSDPLIHLLVLGLDGTWSSHVFGTKADDHTRPIVQVDTVNRRVYMFATAPCCSGGIVYMKSASLDDIEFEPGLGTPVIASSTNPKANNPTTAKQSVTPQTGLVVLASDDSTRTYLHAAISLGEAPDTTPPDTSIATGPAAASHETSATFTFIASEAGCTFACTLDGAAAAACVSPLTITGLEPGPHEMSIAATDPAGNTDLTPATWVWSVEEGPDTTPPQTTITSAPSGSTSSTTAFVTFVADEDAATFRCSLDGGRAIGCTSPLTVLDLAVGSHEIAVAATDPAGNTDPSPAVAQWYVGPVLLLDGFESGDLGAGGWTAVTGTTGTVTVEPGVGSVGSYGLRVRATTDKGSFAYAQRYVTAAPTLAVAFDLLPASEGKAGKTTSVLKVYDTGSTRVLTLERLNGNGQLRLCDRLQTCTAWTDSAPLGSWTRVAVWLQVTSTTDVVVLSVDGRTTSTPLDLGSRGLSRVRLGNDSLRVALNLVFDEVVLAR